MNLVKIADMLKNASDQSLAQEIQNPTGSVPSYMVLSELDRRKKLRGSLMQPTDSKSVSEDLGAEFGGIAGLNQAPVDEYGVSQAQSEGYAGGGVVHARSGWFGEDVGDDMATDPGYSPNVEPGGLFRTNQMVKPAFTDEQSAKRLKLIKEGMSPENASRTVRGEPILAAAPAAPVVNPAAPPAGPAASRNQGRPGNVPGAAPASNVTQTTQLSPEMADLSEARKAGIEGLSQYNDYLKTAIAENKAQKAENAWQAMTMAGLGMLGGRSQYAAENIGQGAMMGMQQFTGAEQARQKEGRVLAMDMAQSGMKKSDILSNLAKAGFEGKKAEALANKAMVEAKTLIPAQAGYYGQMGAAAGARGSSTGDKLDVQEIKALRADYTKQSVNPMFSKKYPSFDAYLTAMGYSGSRGPSGTMGASNDPLGWRK